MLKGSEKDHNIGTCYWAKLVIYFCNRLASIVTVIVTSTITVTITHLVRKCRTGVVSIG